MGLNRLNGQAAYLCGSIDRAADGGVIWRQEITPLLTCVGVSVNDPCNKKTNLASEDAENRSLRHKWKEAGEFDKLAACKEIRHIDLRMVDRSDFLIVCLDMNIMPCGTYEELFWANRQKKPILVWCVQGKKHAPDWLFWTIPHQMIFDSVKDIMSYLVYIDGDTSPETMGRWVFFDRI